MIPLLAIPLTAKIAIVTTLAAALFSSGLYVGHKWGVSSCYDATIEAQRHTIETGIKQAAVSDQTITKYVDRVQIVQGKSREIIKEVKIYVQDAGNLSSGFRLLHDSAVNNELSNPAGIADADPVPITDVAETVARNYGICHENSTTLSALQEWIRDQAVIR